MSMDHRLAIGVSSGLQKCKPDKSCGRDNTRRWGKPVKTPAVALAFLFLNCIAVGAQVAQIKPLSDDDIKLIRQDIQGSKDAIIKDTMQFSDGEGKAFWPVYKEYAEGQHAIAEKRFAVILD